MKITNGQKKIIHTLIGALGWSDKTYRDFLKRFCGVRSCMGLSYDQAEKLIRELQEFQTECSPMITDKQIGYIKFLWLSVDYDRGNAGDKHLSRFLEKRYGVQRVEELTKHQALGCIAAIKRMQVNKRDRIGTLSVSAVMSPEGSGTAWVHLPTGERYACPIGKEVNNGKPN